MGRSGRLFRSVGQPPVYNSLSWTYRYCHLALRRYLFLVAVAATILYIIISLGNYVLGVNEQLCKGSTETRTQQRKCVDDDTMNDFLCLCTTFKPGTYKIPVYRNTLFNWMSLSPCGRVRAILYDTTSSRIDVEEDHPQQPTFKLSNEDWRSVQQLNRMAKLLGWHVLTLPRVSTYGVPYLKDMFFDVAQRFPTCKFIAYANGDILFNDGLLRTLEVVDKEANRLGDVLAVGRRTNVYMKKLKPILNFSPSGVTRLALSRGELYHDGAHDFFILHRNKFPWSSFPDFVIGRPYYDLYLVAKSLELNVSVIEVSKTVIALHQIDNDGLRSGSRVDLDNGRGFNKAYIGEFVASNGWLRNVRYFTNFAAYENATTQGEYPTLKEIQAFYKQEPQSFASTRWRPAVPHLSDVHVYRRCSPKHGYCSPSTSETHRRIDETA